MYHIQRDTSPPLWRGVTFLERKRVFVERCHVECEKKEKMKKKKKRWHIFEKEKKITWHISRAPLPCVPPLNLASPRKQVEIPKSQHSSH